MKKFLLPLLLLAGCTVDPQETVGSSNRDVPVALFTSFKDRDLTCNVYQLDTGSRYVYTTVCGSGVAVKTNYTFSCGKNCTTHEEVGTAVGN